MMGRDALSDAPGLVIFSNHSYLTEKGRYDALQDRFTPAPGVLVAPDYAQTTLEEVNDMFTYSSWMLDLDYYSGLSQLPW
jgi:hypothetical protein